MSAPDVVYRVDPKGLITYVNEAWDRFARENASPHLESSRVLSKPLLDWISDRTTRALYSRLLERVRAGKSARFTLRCDSPDRRRLLEMSAAPAPGGEVEFRVRTVSIEERSPLALLDPAAPRSGELVRACGWCKRLDAGGRWVEAEEAAARLRLMERSPLPMITHGICADCETDMLRTLEP